VVVFPFASTVLSATSRAGSRVVVVTQPIGLVTAVWVGSAPVAGV
jgi:hypothetical protein